MSGELRTSQFRWTTTDNSDFVIGSPDDVGSYPNRYLVFQTSTTPGYAANPHMMCSYNSGLSSWELQLNTAPGGGYLNLSGIAYKSQPNDFTGNNTFAGTSIFNTGSFTVNSAATFTGTSIFNTGTFTVNSVATFNNTVNLTNDVIVSGNLTVNGTLTNVNTTNLEVKDKLITLNNGSITTDGGGSGIEIEESSGGHPGYFKTSAARTGWELKAPATAGIITLIPTATSVSLTMPTSTGTLALTSDLHSAVTLGTANGLSLSTQALSLGLASTSTTGALSSADWNTFNGKQDALGYTAANDTAVVHLAGPETITGDKTFLGIISSYGPGTPGDTTYENHFGYSQWLYRGAVNAPLEINTGYFKFGGGVTDSATGPMIIQSYFNTTTGSSITFNSYSLSLSATGVAVGISSPDTTTGVLEVSGGTTGTAIILTDKTTGVRHKLYIDSGVLTVGLA
jgi:hypothetical protein